MRITDYWFARLEYDLARTIRDLDELQKMYSKLTGKEFVVSRSVLAYKAKMESLEE